MPKRFDAGKGRATRCKQGRGGETLELWIIAVPACLQRLAGKSSDGEVNAGVIKLGDPLELPWQHFPLTSIEPFYYFT